MQANIAETKISLTPSQEVADKTLRDFLSGKLDDRELVLTGYAGCGKTFLLQHVLKDFTHMEIIACTISHAAKGVLRSNMPEGIPCTTLASGLNLRQVFYNGEEKFVKVNSQNMPPVFFCEVLIVDECSMIDDTMKRYINESVNTDCRIIYSGDRAQLPPVETKGKKKQTISPVFNIPLQVNLTEIVRYGELIGTLSQYYRDLIEYVERGGNEHSALSSIVSYNPVWDNGNEQVIFTRDHHWFLHSAIEDFQKDMLNTRIIAYRNATIDTNNDVIHPYFFDPYLKYPVGSYMVLNRPYRTPGSQETLLHNGTVIHIKDAWEDIEEFSVDHPTELDSKMEPVKISLKVWKLKVRTIDLDTREEGDQVYTVSAIHQDSEEEYEDIQQQIIDKAKQTDTPKLWRNLSQLRAENLFAGRYYCMSAYKSQGQSISNVYYMLTDTMDTETINTLTKLRSTYVAVTRSKKKLIVLV